jgi:small subunit ribosomal protein S1
MTSWLGGNTQLETHLNAALGRNWMAVVKGGTKTKQGANAREKPNEMRILLDTEFPFKALKYGDIVAGTVVHVEPREILIDIGAKSEGIVASKELEAMSSDALKKMHVGDRLLAFVLRPENRDGNVVLSLARAQMETDWREAERLLQAGESFEAQVAGYNKGGLIVRVGKVRGFVPIAQLENIPPKKAAPATAEEIAAESTEPPVELTPLVGKKLQFKIIEIDRPRNRLILSERAAMRGLRKTRKEELLNSLKEGDIVTGTVTTITDFGVFVSLGEVDGLIHASELSWGKVNHPKDIVNVGDKIQAQVIMVERDRERVGLSLKRLTPEPWTTVEERYKVGQLVNATITKLAQFGAFARLEDNIEGLIHISELANRRINHPREVVKEGQTLALRVIRIDPARRRLGLSLKRVEEDDGNYLASEDAPPEEPSVQEEPTP